MIQKECSRRRRLLTCLFACLVGVAGAAVADDRDLLRERAGEPFVFVIFDTSSSMSSTPEAWIARAIPVPRAFLKASQVDP